MNNELACRTASLGSIPIASISLEHKIVGGKEPGIIVVLAVPENLEIKIHSLLHHGENLKPCEIVSDGWTFLRSVNSKRSVGFGYRIV